MTKKVTLVGYSGHAYVAAEIILQSGRQLLGYFEQKEKVFNPFDLTYLGDERAAGALSLLAGQDYFVAIGDNDLRARVSGRMWQSGFAPPASIVHPAAVIGARVSLGAGVMVAPGAIINPLAIIGDGVICNTACVIEHECRIGNFVHVGPGAVLTGNVIVGEGSLIGARAVIKPGVRLGKRVIVGAGAVVLRDVPDGQTVVGNPGKVWNGT